MINQLEGLINLLLKTHLHELTLLLEVFCNTSCAVDTFFISFPKSKHNLLAKGLALLSQGKCWSPA